MKGRILLRDSNVNHSRELGSEYVTVSTNEKVARRKPPLP